MADDVFCVLVVLCEAAADYRAARTLSDRVLCEHVDWIDASTIDYYRRYQGLHESESFIDWDDMKAAAKRLDIRVHGHRDGAPRSPFAAAAERALLVFATLVDRPRAVIMTHDADAVSERRQGFEQARSARPWPFEVVIGIAEAKRECWVLAGYDPQTEAERERLAEARRDLGFDPREQAGRLSAGDERAKLNAKRVLKLLTGDSVEREHSCLLAADIEVLKRRGAASGLAAYLSELEERLVPLFDPSEPPGSTRHGG